MRYQREHVCLSAPIIRGAIEMFGEVKAPNRKEKMAVFLFPDGVILRKRVKYLTRHRKHWAD